MPALILYHNPRCSKSREALSLLEARHADVEVRLYLKTPLSFEELRALASRLDAPIETLIRTNEPEWKTLSVDIASDDQCLAAIAEHPRLLQRPILDRGDLAVIGRPPEAVLTLLDNA